MQSASALMWPGLLESCVPSNTPRSRLSENKVKLQWHRIRKGAGISIEEATAAVVEPTERSAMPLAMPTHIITQKSLAVDLPVRGLMEKTFARFRYDLTVYTPTVPRSRNSSRIRCDERPRSPAAQTLRAWGL